MMKRHRFLRMEMKCLLKLKRSSTTEKPVTSSLRNYSKLIKWCKDFGFLQAAMDHAQNKKRLMEHVSMLD